MVQQGARVVLTHQILVRVQVSDPYFGMVCAGCPLSVFGNHWRLQRIGTPSQEFADRWRSQVVAIGCQPKGHGFESHTVRQSLGDEERGGRSQKRSCGRRPIQFEHGAVEWTSARRPTQPAGRRAPRESFSVLGVNGKHESLPSLGCRFESDRTLHQGVAQSGQSSRLGRGMPLVRIQPP